MEYDGGYKISHIEILCPEYQEWLKGVEFFLEAEYDEEGFFLQIVGLIAREDNFAFQGACCNMYPLPNDLGQPSDENVWEQVNRQYSLVFAKDARLIISDEEIRLHIGENFSSLIEDYEMLGGPEEEYVDNESDDLDFEEEDI